MRHIRTAGGLVSRRSAALRPARGRVPRLKPFIANGFPRRALQGPGKPESALNIPKQVVQYFEQC